MGATSAVPISVGTETPTVPVSAAAVASIPESPTAEVWVGALHVRACVAMDCRVVGYVVSGDRVDLTGKCEGEWVELADGEWVFSEFLRLEPCG